MTNAGRRRRPICTLLSTLAVSLVVTGGCENSDPSESSSAFASVPERSVEGRELHYFEDLRSMAAESDVVLRAHVSAVDVGKTYGESEEDQFTTRFVTLSPETVIKGRLGPDPLIYEEEGWQADGEGYVMNGVLWSRPGDEAWYFLRLSDGGRYRLVASYGRYAIKAAQRGPSGYEPQKEGPWSVLPVSTLNDPEAASSAIRDSVDRSGS